MILAIIQKVDSQYKFEILDFWNFEKILKLRLNWQNRVHFTDFFLNEAFTLLTVFILRRVKTSSVERSCNLYDDKCFISGKFLSNYSMCV